MAYVLHRPPCCAIVQRFKQAKAFFRLARQSFDIEVIPVGTVVDYDVLSWGNWTADASGAGGSEAVDASGAAAADGDSPLDQPPLRTVCSTSADFDAYVAAQARAQPVPAAAAHPSDVPSPPVVWHAVDSDSDPDEDKAGSFLAGFSCKGVRAAADASGADEAAADVVIPHKAYIYILTRKPVVARGQSRKGAGQRDRRGGDAGGIRGAAGTKGSSM